MGEEKYDFYAIGQKHAADAMDSIKQLADSYEKNYGAEAKRAFELGVASVFSQYHFLDQVDSDTPVDYDAAINGTGNYGVYNTRNNSYFGGTGTSYQTVKDSSGNRVFNEPGSHRTK